MGLITFAIVLIRYGFDSGDVAVQESVVYLHAVAFMLGIAYTFKHDEHVRVDVVYSRLTTESRAWVNVSGHVLFLLPCTLTIGWYSISYAGASWRILEGSMEAGGIPALFLLKSLIPAMAVTLLAQGISETVKSVRIILDDGHGKRSK